MERSRLALIDLPQLPAKSIAVSHMSMSVAQVVILDQYD
jgi:hypothetical protein